MESYFGDWIKNPKQYQEEFINAKPFPHIIIKNFLNSYYAKRIHDDYPTNYSNWDKYLNPIEVKYTYNNVSEMPLQIQKLFELLSSEFLNDSMSKISGIQNLETDPYLHGAGLHVHPKNGRLHLHLDYEKHPLLNNKQRRLNIILYLSKNWKEEWNGHTELWNQSECIVKSKVEFNTALIFKTNEVSWHGVPEKIKCPKDVFRKTLAYYYISPLTNCSQIDKFGATSDGYRVKAAFIKRPQDEDRPELQELYSIRPNRRIEKEDMECIWPDWTPELF
jgi:Rps23 Pro-64 3,4-dihydroxylase Tpa1-like proline 4-hydroxylase